MPNNKVYKVVADKEYGAPYAGENIYYERLDSLSGKVLQWDSSNSSELLKYNFSACLVILSML